MKLLSASLWMVGLAMVQIPVYVVVEHATKSGWKAWLSAVSVGLGVTAMFWSNAIEPFTGPFVP
jgi:hypothetical protein